MGDEVKCVVGGDSAVGKTTLIQYLTGKEADDKIYNITMPVAHLDFDNVTLGVYDVGLQYEDVSKHSFDGASVVVLCYSIISPQSFDNVLEKWYPVLQSVPLKPGQTSIPIILLATKRDLRNDPRILDRLAHHNLTPVSEREGKGLAKQLGALHFEEISLYDEDAFEVISRVFKTAAEGTTKKEKVRPAKTGCCVVV